MTASTYGVLGQGQPAAATLTPIYTVPTGRKTIAKIIVCNTGSSADAFRVAGYCLGNLFELLAGNDPWHACTHLFVAISHYRDSLFVAIAIDMTQNGGCATQSHALSRRSFPPG